MFAGDRAQNMSPNRICPVAHTWMNESFATVSIAQHSPRPISQPVDIYPLHLDESRICIYVQISWEPIKPPLSVPPSVQLFELLHRVILLYTSPYFILLAATDDGSLHGCNISMQVKYRCKIRNSLWKQRGCIHCFQMRTKMLKSSRCLSFKTQNISRRETNWYFIGKIVNNFPRRTVENTMNNDQNKNKSD